MVGVETSSHLTGPVFLFLPGTLAERKREIRGKIGACGGFSLRKTHENPRPKKKLKKNSEYW